MTTTTTTHSAGAADRTSTISDRRRRVAALIAGALAVSIGVTGTASADGRSGPAASTPTTSVVGVSQDDTSRTGNRDLGSGDSDGRLGGPGELAGLSPSGYTLDVTKVQPHGTYATFAYTTNAPSVTLRLSTWAPTYANGVWSDPIMDTIVGPELIEGTGDVKYGARMLTPDTTYYYILTVPTNVDQIPVQAVGSFTTLHRTLTIVWNSIHVTDDSDPGAKGAGDFTFWFRANGKPIASFSKDIKSDSTYDIDIDGQGTPLSYVIDDVPNTEVPLSIQLFENDIQKWDVCDGWLTGGEEWDGEPIDQENSCGTWASMTWTYDAHPGMYGPGYGYHEGDPITFEMSPYQSSVHLTVTGTITASWT